MGLQEMQDEIALSQQRAYASGYQTTANQRKRTSCIRSRQNWCPNDLVDDERKLRRLWLAETLPKSTHLLASSLLKHVE